MRIFTLKLLAPAVVSFGLFLVACSDSEKEEFSPKPVEKMQPDPVAEYQVFKVKKGNHYADASNAGEVKSNKFRFQVIFDSSAVYKTIDPINQFDINKLYGFSDCNSFHQINSARFGWCWVNNQLEIHAYTYKNGLRNSQFIKAIPLGEPVEMGISITDSTYVFQVQNRTETLPRACSGNISGYKLFPYFGGDEVAPHDIVVKIKDL